MAEVEIPPSSVSVGHGCVKDEGSEARGGHCVRNHTSLTPENHDLASAIGCTYGDSVHGGARADALSVNKVSSSRKANVDVADSETESSEDNNEKNWELSYFSTPEKR